VTLLTISEPLRLCPQRLVCEAGVHTQAVLLIYQHCPSVYFFMDMVKEAQVFSPIILRCLSACLDVLHINSATDINILKQALYHSLRIACLDPTCTIDATQLVITSRPGASNMLTYFAFTCNIVHLILTSDDVSTRFNSSLPSLRLESLVLQMEFSRDPTALACPLCPVLSRACCGLHARGCSPSLSTCLDIAVGWIRIHASRQ
jgi:hypothetical protein